jgi:epoxyqueuosine reductase
MQLKQVIQEEAKSLGFARVGVTTPDPPSHVPAYEHWLRAGRHAGMAYLADEEGRARRADPRRILPECRSILLLAMPYSPQNNASALPGRGRVAAYAWGDDYHEVLPGRLRQIVERIQAEVGRPVANRCYTDTGPLLERDLAQRAGLGWIGKNTCLIHPELGSYFFLAEILLDVELESDPPFLADRCGTCTRCMQACPTGCILPDRSLDARRCIAYLTIELKGQIPHELRSSLGNWVFGCDICQQVCPWNRFAPQAVDPAFAARAGVPMPVLESEMLSDSEHFNRKFKHSPVQRARRRGFLRNIAVALGNQQEHAAVPALQQALQHDPEGLVRGHAAWALGQIGGEDARRALDFSRQHEIDPQVLAEIKDAFKMV